MYDSRWLNVCVLLFWLASVGWLMRTKVFPYVRDGETPQQGIVIPDKPWAETRVDWRIILDGTSIGTASNRAIRRVDGTAVVISHVMLEKLPVEQLAREFLGPFSGWLQWGLEGRADLVVDLDVETEMMFDAFGQPDRLRSDVDMSGMEDILQLRGQFRPDGLLLSATTLPLDVLENKDAQPVEVFRRNISLPKDAMVVDSFSPAPRLENLSVGQEWSYRAVRPFPPGEPWQMVRARVVSLDAIQIDGRYQDVFIVTFTDSGASSLTTAENPSTTLWVRPDGVVLRQEFTLGGIEMTFERLLDED